jgi:hypothetical protein
VTDKIWFSFGKTVGKCNFALWANPGMIVQREELHHSRFAVLLFVLLFPRFLFLSFPTTVPPNPINYGLGCDATNLFHLLFPLVINYSQ